MNQWRLKRSAEKRSGMLSLELVLVLPLIATILFAVCEFGLLFSGRQSLVAASRAAARVATLAGATQDDVAQTVQDQLEPELCQELRIDAELGRHSGDLVVVTLSLPMTSVSPDLLRFIGLSLRDHDLVAETVMCKE